MTEPVSLIALSVAALVVGTLIGAVGIGGVLLVPALLYFTPLEVHQSMATALASFVATGIAGSIAFQRRGSIDWPIAWPLCAGAVAFSFLGAMLNAFTGSLTLTLILASIIVSAGVYSIASSRRQAGGTSAVGLRARSWTLASIGAVAGLGAGLTGTGGPLLSVPLMLMFGFPLLASIGASQVVQIVASVFGTAGNLAYGTIDFVLLPQLVVFEVLGVLLGVKIVHAVDPARVRLSVAWLCVLVGVGMVMAEFGPG